MCTVYNHGKHAWLSFRYEDFSTVKGRAMNTPAAMDTQAKINEAMSVRWAPRSQRRSKPWAKGTLGPAVCIAVARRDFITGELHLRAGDMVTVHPSVTDTREGWCIVQGPRASGAVPETLLEIR